MSFSKTALDRSITGNWGEDSVPDLPPICEDCDVDPCNEPCEKHKKFMAEWEEDQRKLEESLGLYEYDEDQKEEGVFLRR